MSQIPASDFFSSLDHTIARETVINWPNLVVRVLDDYRERTTIPHGVQKDAIQNSWDARRNRRRGTGWGVRFELIEDRNGQRFLAITDRGTSGLTGRLLQAHEYELDLPEEERWGRFESLAFTHAPTEDSLGARGQGKFIFVGASSTRRILYDTLRTDRVYRLGLRLIVPTRSPVFAWEGDEAKAMLTRYSPDLRPLAEVGARVVIDAPEDEIVDAIESGKFARHIGETWWQIIERFDADIRVTTFGGRARRVRRPRDLELPDADTGRYDVWPKELLSVEYAGTRYRIKRLHVVRDRRGPVAEDIRGVALVRGGMKVMSVPMHHVPREISDAVYGYAEFDRALEEEMKRLESPTHYAFDLTRGVGRKVKQVLEDELARFAREKLGVGADPRAVERERHREAERRALYAINRAARELGITGRIGPAVGDGGGGDGRVEHPLRIDMPAPSFPREIRRVNYGETIRDIQARVVNDTNHSARVRLSVYVFQGDALVIDLGSRDLTVRSNAGSDAVGPFSIAFSPDDHLPGEHVLRARLLALEVPEYSKGYELHKVTFRFWIEEDPPQRGIFDDIEGLEYREQPSIDGEAVPSESGGSYRFQYNVSHPAKRKWDETEDDLYDYLFRLMARELIYIDLRGDEPKLFETEHLESPAKLAQRSGEIQGMLMYRFYS